MVAALLGAVAAWFKTTAELRLENLALRQQLGVLRRSAPKRLRLTKGARAFWVWMKRVWPCWYQVLMIASGNRAGLASQRVSLVLDVACPAWQARPADHPAGNPRSDPNDKPQQPALGCTAHSQRIAEAGHRDYRAHCRQVTWSGTESRRPRPGGLSCMTPPFTTPHRFIRAHSAHC
jgi:hypothetical protein